MHNVGKINLASIFQKLTSISIACKRSCINFQLEIRLCLQATGYNYVVSIVKT